jgi:hypothetical protein
MPNHRYEVQVRFASGLNVLLGGLLIASPWLFDFVADEHDLTRNCVVIGALIVICAALRTIWPRARVAWSGANIAFGFWTLISSVTFGHMLDEGYVWLSVALGLSVMILASWSGNASLAAQRNWGAGV